MTKDETEKYRQLYTMAEDAFNNEDARYNRMEDTAHKYVPVMLFLVSADGYLAKWVLDKLVVPSSLLDWIGILCICIAFGTLLISGALLYRSFRYEDVKLLRPDNDVVSFFDNHDLQTIYRLFAIQYNKEREINSRITDKKVAIREKSYRTLLISFIFLILTGLVFVIHSYTQKVMLCS